MATTTPHHLVRCPLPWLGIQTEEILAKAETWASRANEQRPPLDRQHLGQVGDEVLAHLRLRAAAPHLCLVGDAAVALRLARTLPWAKDRGTPDIDLLVDTLSVPKAYVRHTEQGPAGNATVRSSVKGSSGHHIDVHWRRIGGDLVRLHKYTLQTAEHFDTSLPVARGEALIALRLAIHPDALTQADITNIRLLLAFGGVFVSQVLNTLRTYTSPVIADRGAAILQAIKPAPLAAKVA